MHRFSDIFPESLSKIERINRVFSVEKLFLKHQRHLFQDGWINLSEGSLYILEHERQLFQVKIRFDNAKLSYVRKHLIVKVILLNC